MELRLIQYAMLAFEGYMVVSCVYTAWRIVRAVSLYVEKKRRG